MRMFGAFAIGTLVSFSAIAQDEKIGDQTRDVSKHDAAINAAIAQAQATLGDFLLVAKSPPAGSGDFKIKVRLSDGSSVEHLWFTPFKEVEGGFVGVLANEPDLIRGVQVGTPYKIYREQITDWGYVQDGKQKGSFTVCAMFQTMEKEVVAQYQRDHGFECN